MRFSALVVVAAAFGCAVRADWLPWSDGGDGQMTTIPRETGTLSSYSPDGWSPKPTVAPDAVQAEASHVLAVLKREASTSGWLNEKTCGWIAGVQSSSFGCGENATCVTNANHIVACATGTFSPFYSMCLDYDAYTSGLCKNDDSSTGCCMDSAYPACVTYLWIEPPRRSMYRCWKTPTIISMLDKPEVVEDHPTVHATATTPPFINGTPGQKQGSDSGMSGGALIGLTIGIIVVTFIVGLLAVRYVKQRREIVARRGQANAHANVHDGFNGGSGNGQGNGSTVIGRVLARLLDALGLSRTSGTAHVDTRTLTGGVTTGATHGSDGQVSPDPPSYTMHSRPLGQSRPRIPGGTFSGVPDITGLPPPEARSGANAQFGDDIDMDILQRPETPPPTYQPSIQSASTLSGFVPVNSNATFTNAYGGTENWIELSRSSPTLPTAARRDTMWFPDVSSIPASSVWQDVSGSQLSNDDEDTTAPIEPPHTPRLAKATLAVSAEDETVFEDQPRRRRQ
ncbi:hypothetical protein F5B19DRAFT_93685 [Rostrohypoxylon terebratum]|nr:hypothetical protein F5B19DRAFT_93685 [Rostrohypoxylon terebratum]